MPKILFIDDEPVIRFIGKKTLEKVGFKVTVAGDADEAMDRFTAEKYDLVITDLAVPGQVGFSTVHKMKKLRADQRVLVVSGGDLGSQGFLEEKEKAGVTCVLAKPFELTDLVQSVRDCLSDKAA